VVLLLSGLAVVTYEAWAAKTRRPNASDRGYVAIPLAEGQGRPSSEQTWPFEQRAHVRRRLSKRALAAGLGLLLFVLSGRIGLFYAVMRDVECAGPPLMAFLPLVLALFHGFRDTSPRQTPAWSADSPPASHRDRFVHFFLHGPTRYILPSLLLSISSFLVTLRTSALRSTYICPTATSAALLIPRLQFMGFLLDCILVLLLYRLIEEGRSQAEQPLADSRDGTSINGLIGLTFTVGHLVRVQTVLADETGICSGRWCSGHGCLLRNARTARVAALCAPRIFAWSSSFVFDDTPHDFMFSYFGRPHFRAGLPIC
jgi:hypothetical protein